MKTKLITLLASLLFVAVGTVSVAQAEKKAKKRPLSGGMKTALALGDEMLEHVSAMFKLLDGDKEKCDQSLAAVKKYVEKNKSDLEALKAKMLKLEKQLSEKEKDALKEIMRERTQKYMQEVMGTMMVFSQNCPQQAGQLGQVMGVLSTGEQGGGAPPPPPGKPPRKKTK